MTFCAVCEAIWLSRSAIACRKRRAAGLLQVRAANAGVTIDRDGLEQSLPARGEFRRTLQILVNLIGNAVRYSPEGATIWLRAQREGDRAVVIVADQGKGIAEPDQARIFEKFERVDASEAGGSGLGLAICRAIVAQHNGRIWAERNPVRGSTFRVFLPYQPASTGKEHEVNGLHPSPHGAVLVADSCGATRPLIVEQLSRHGYRVVEANTPEQAVAVAHEGVEAILLDTTLDGVNGWEILPQLRRDKPESQTPVIITSVASSTVVPENGSKAVRLGERPADEILMAEAARVLCEPGELMRVLVVEDDVDLARMIGRIFTMDRIAVKTVHTRQAALDEFLAFEPHLLVLDIGLPNGDGFNIVEWLRQRESLIRLPLVVYSGRNVTPAVRGEMMLGPTNFLTRASVEAEQLETLLLTLLRSSHELEEAAPEIPASQNI